VQQQQHEQQHYHTLLNPPMQQEYVDVSNQYLLHPADSQNELQTGQLPPQYQLSLNLSQLPADMFTFSGLPTYSISQLTNQQQVQAHAEDSNLVVHGQQVTASIQQQNDVLSTRQNLFTHRQQRQQQWLSHYPYLRQREVQTPNELFMSPIQSEHQLDRQNSVQDMLEVFPMEPSEYVQLQVSIFGYL